MCRIQSRVTVNRTELGSQLGSQQEEEEEAAAQEEAPPPPPPPPAAPGEEEAAPPAPPRQDLLTAMQLLKNSVPEKTVCSQVQARSGSPLKRDLN